jgi:fibronectin type 3 domain-containing protein
MDQSPVVLRLTKVLAIPVFAFQLWSCSCGAANNSHTLTPKQHSVSLSWNASTSPVAGYNVYRGTQHSGLYSQKVNSSLLSATNFTDSTVQSGTTYYYVVTAVDSEQVESDYSNEARAVVPSP